MNPAADPSPVPTSKPATVGIYTLGEVTERIRLYMLIGALTSVIGQLADLASMQDAQLAAISPLRWAIKLSLLALGAILAAVNAKRAAIDRSTSAAGAGAAVPPVPAEISLVPDRLAVPEPLSSTDHPAPPAP